MPNELSEEEEPDNVERKARFQTNPSLCVFLFVHDVCVCVYQLETNQLKNKQGN